MCKCIDCLEIESYLVILALYLITFSPIENALGYIYEKEQIIIILNFQDLFANNALNGRHANN